MMAEVLAGASFMRALQQPRHAPRLEHVALHGAPDIRVSGENQATRGPADERHGTVAEIRDEMKQAAVLHRPVDLKGPDLVKLHAAAARDLGYERHDVALANRKQASIVFQPPGVAWLRDGAPVELDGFEGRRIRW